MPPFLIYESPTVLCMMSYVIIEFGEDWPLYEKASGKTDTNTIIRLN